MYLKVKMQSAAKLKNPSEVSCVNQRLAAVVYIVNTIVLFCNGILQIKAFKEPGGEKLKEWIDGCPNQLYSALIFEGGKAIRERILND